jgi:LVIVD repeat
MRRLSRLLLLSAVGAVALFVLPAVVAADHNTRESENLRALGHSPHPATFLGQVSALREVNSDLAFWRNLTFHGNYDGFRIIRNRPFNPQEINWTHCNGDQGDVVVWGDILVRAWNSPAPADDPATPVMENRFCDGQPVPVGFEGMHIFDISDLSNPKLVGEVELSARPQADMPGCGTHTLTLVPDLRDGRVLIYNATSGGNPALPPALAECDFLDIIQVPLDDPGAASHLNRVPLEGGHAAHDNGVILGKVNKLAVASGHMSNVFDIGRNSTPGGSPEEPVPLFTIEEEGVCFEPDTTPSQPERPCNGNWHSAAFTWDGEVIIMGWEPGGGSFPECEETDPDVKKSAFFYDADTGEKLGQWTLPRHQIGLAEATPEAGAENCTIHNYNTVPTRDGSYILVGGHYQAGTWVVDFSDPTNPETIGFADPDPLPQVTSPTTGMLINELGGAWASYWYNGLIYESEITKGLNLFRYTGKETRRAVRLKHLNPQTQEFSLDGKRGDDDDDDDDDRGGKGGGDDDDD